MINREVASKLFNLLQLVVGNIDLNQLDKAKDAVRVLSAFISVHLEERQQ